jgi:SAM-dependent methyltransferase
MADRTEPASTFDPNAVYSLGSSARESSRLLRQAGELPAANALRSGQARSRSTSGPLDIPGLLSDRVGPSGRVVGVDADPRHVATRVLGNVEVVVGDARNTSLASSSFDVVHARTPLVNVPRPLDVVVELVRLAKPGGWVLRVAEPYRSAGLIDIQVEARDDPCWTLCVDLIHCSSSALQRKPDSTIRCRGHPPRRPRHVMPHLMFLLSGRKPTTA